MLETHMRPMMQPLFNVLGRTLVSMQLTPNMVTILALLTGGACGVLIAMNELPAALAMLWVSGLFDVLDGTMARLMNKARKVGAYMDLICDRMVECSVIIGFAMLYPQHSLAYITFLAAVLVHFSTFLAAGSLFKNTSVKSMHYEKSIVERCEAFVVFSVMMVYPEYIFEVLMALNAVILLSGLSRFMRVIYAASPAKKARSAKAAK